MAAAGSQVSLIARVVNTWSTPTNRANSPVPEAKDVQGRVCSDPSADDLARVRELAAASVALGSPRAYFQAGDDKLSNPAKRPFFVDIERDLQRLDEAAWTALKAEALPRLAAPAQDRGWEELFSILNQARGYNYLTELGCAGVEFVPRGRGKTPDLKATLGATRFLCEVKTIHISADEVARRQSGGVGTSQARVTPQFLGKLRRDIDAARDQMVAFDASATKITYVVVNFDDVLHEYALEYEAQIASDLKARPLPGVDVKLDIKRPFY
jgi:hypothetical protein